LHGVQGVEGSNPSVPTNKIKDLASQGAKSFLLGGFKNIHCPYHCPNRSES